MVLDGWMHPVDDKIFSSLKQPILMINMESFQWPVNIKQMMRLLEAGGEADRNMITVRYVRCESLLCLTVLFIGKF